MTILLVVFTILLVLVSLSMFVPLLRGVENPLLFFSSKSDARDRRGHERQGAIDSLRDLLTERDSGKMSDEEFQMLAAPLARVLGGEAGPQAAALKEGAVTNGKRTRLGKFCPDCGSLEPGKLCIQCGADL